MSPTAHDELAARLATVRERIESACAAAGRAPSAVRVVAVTKTHPTELARRAVELGLVDLGENRVQELLAKAPQVPGARWHFVGRLQRNKARDLVGRQLLIHSVDRRSLAETLSRHARDQGVAQRVLVQVNVGDDPAKGGCCLDQALDLVAYSRDLPNLAVEGLMTVPQRVGDPRPSFARLRALRDQARDRWPEVAHLSMGMSDDFEIAIAEGATIVRVGSALFGPRRT